MGQGVDFIGTNRRFKAPEGDEETIDSIDVYDNGRCVVTAWKLTDDELAEILASGTVYLTMMTSPNLVPHFVGSETTVRDVIADYAKGVWKK